MKNKKSALSKFFNRFSNAVTRATGKPIAFIIATYLICQKKKEIYLPHIQFDEAHRNTVNKVERNFAITKIKK